MSLFQQYPSVYPRMGLSFGIEKEIISRLSAIDNLTDAMFRQVVADSYGIIHAPELVKNVLDQLVGRVLARIEDLQKKEEKANKKKRPKKTFGSSYADWLSELDATHSCLYVTDNDIDKALKLYWEEDFLLVQEAVKVKSGHESQITLTRMEASMYGFGGKYADDTGGDANTFDLDEMGADDIKSAMAGFGF